MPNTANLALPYPADSDPVMDGNEAIQALAEGVDNKIHRGVSTQNADASGDITIAHGMAAAPTAVLVTQGRNDANWTAAVHTIGGASFKVRSRTANTAAAVAAGTSVTIYWIAIA